MPHLDAKALTDDPEGMKFLADVIGSMRDPSRPASIVDSRTDEIQPLAELPSPRRRRRKIAALVPEAA